MRIPWEFRLIDKPEVEDPRIEYLEKFFKKPDRETRWHAWGRMLLDDLLILEAATLYVEKSTLGIPYAINVIDGATIFPLIDDWGRRPIPPDPAYQQIIKGRPAINLSSADIIYAPMHLRPNHRPYGYSPVEQLYVEIMMSIRRELYQLDYYTEGTIPDMIVTVPKEWTPNQVNEFQATFDFLLEGNAALKSKVRFMPGDMKPFEIKQPILKNDYDEWLARILCFAFSIPPTAFVRMMNRGTAETSQEEAIEEGLMPLMAWWKDEIMDPIVQEHFGWDDIEFTFTAEEQIDQLKEEQTLVGYVDGGILTPDEARDRLGEKKLGMDKLMVKTGSGVQLVEDIMAGKTPAQQPPPAPVMPGMAGKPTPGGAGAGKGKPAGKKPVKKGLSEDEELQHAVAHNNKGLERLREASEHHEDCGIRLSIGKSLLGDVNYSAARCAKAMGGAEEECFHVRKHLKEIQHPALKDADMQHEALRGAIEKHAQLTRAIADGDADVTRHAHNAVTQKLGRALELGEGIDKTLGDGPGLQKLDDDARDRVVAVRDYVEGKRDLLEKKKALRRGEYFGSLHLKTRPIRKRGRSAWNGY